MWSGRALYFSILCTLSLMLYIPEVINKKKKSSVLSRVVHIKSSLVVPTKSFSPCNFLYTYQILLARVFLATFPIHIKSF